MTDARREAARKYREAHQFLDRMGVPEYSPRDCQAVGVKVKPLDLSQRLSLFLVDVARGDRVISVDLVRKAFAAKSGEKV